MEHAARLRRSMIIAGGAAVPPIATNGDGMPSVMVAGETASDVVKRVLRGCKRDWSGAGWYAELGGRVCFGAKWVWGVVGNCIDVGTWKR